MYATKSAEVASESTQGLAGAKLVIKDADQLRMHTKECPVCHARCFADMDVCYGCLHAFKAEESETPLEVRLPLIDAEEAKERTSERLPVADEVGSQQPVEEETVEELQVNEELVKSLQARLPLQAAPSKPRLDQVLELVISIRVAQDALVRSRTKQAGVANTHPEQASAAKAHHAQTASAMARPKQAALTKASCDEL